jgi:hypothetical protein
MIAEEELANKHGLPIPTISISRDTLIYTIINLMKHSVPFFKSYIFTHVAKRSLNENELTQIFVEQLDIQLRKLDYPFGVKTQYQDIYYRSSGFSDFYFHPIEEGKSTASIFSVESKRLLVSTTKNREKEYVIGAKENGGIERYKIEKHGKGLLECGILGFVEKEDFYFWVKNVNSWITDLAKSDVTWNKDEVLKELENQIEYMYLNSPVHATTSRKMLHHIWINICSKT